MLILFLGKVDEKATQLHAIASLKVLLDATKPQRGAATSTAANHVKLNLKETTLVGDRPNGNIDTTLESVNIVKITNFYYMCGFSQAQAWTIFNQTDF